MPTSLFLIWPVGQAVKTAASHAVNVGSIPARVIKNHLSLGSGDFFVSVRGIEQGDGAAAPGQTVQWTVCQPAGALFFTHHISQAIESVAATDSVFVFMGVTERLRQSLVLPMKR